MAETLSGFNISAVLQAVLNNSIDGGAQSAAVTQGLSKSLTSLFATGTSANQANGIWSDTARALASAATEDLDVYDLAAFDIGAGAGLDALGQARAHTKVVGLLIFVATTSVGNLLIGGKGTAAAWNSLFNADDDAKLVLGPGGLLLAVNPGSDAWAVADTSNHLLTLEASGGDVTYDAVLLTRG